MRQVIITDPCPRCGSIRTGIIIYDNYFHEQKTIQRNAKKGVYTIIRPKERMGRFDIKPNCFCNECYMEWCSSTTTDLLTDEEYHTFIKERGLDPLLIKPNKRKMFRKFKKHRKGDKIC